MKTLFVWGQVSGITDNYHDGGCVAAIADSLDAARQLIGRGEPMTAPPDFTAPVQCDEDRVFVFPDAGCC